MKSESNLNNLKVCVVGAGRMGADAISSALRKGCYNELMRAQQEILDARCMNNRRTRFQTQTSGYRLRPLLPYRSLWP